LSTEDYKKEKFQMQTKKLIYLIPIVILIGIVTLFFFPEPETNFFAYLGTALFFVILIIFLVVWQRRKK
jgi:L-asparagine transporter-like permease